MTVNVLQGMGAVGPAGGLAAQLSKDGFVSWHLEDSNQRSSVSDFEDARQRLVLALEQLSAAGAEGALCLLLPLEMTEDLSFDGGDPRSWRPVAAEPPSFYYFVRPPSIAGPFQFEQYRRTVIVEHGLEVDYVCGRSLRDRDKGWEFARYFWLKAVAPGGTAS